MYCCIYFLYVVCVDDMYDVVGQYIGYIFVDYCSIYVKCVLNVINGKIILRVEIFNFLNFNDKYLLILYICK